MKFHSYIGVFPEEKIVGQNIEVDLIVTMEQDFTESDKIEDTLSYADFYVLIEEIVKESRVDLIETLAMEMIHAIKKNGKEKIKKVQVNIRKLAVPMNGIFDHVEVEMEG